jgi:ribosomal-protein-alanine N-acetyltransferase
MKIETKRLILREWKKSDAKDLTAILNNIKVSKWLIMVPYPYTRKNAHRDILDSIKRRKQKNRENYNLAIELKKEKKLIGEAELVTVDKFQGKAEVDSWLGEKYWKNGYAKEALEAILKFSFDKLKLRRVEARRFEDNFRSKKLLEKFGFKKEGIKRKAAKSKADGKIKDEIIYSLLKEEWNRIK